MLEGVGCGDWGGVCFWCGVDVFVYPDEGWGGVLDVVFYGF